MEPYQTPSPLGLHKKGCQAFNVGQAQRVSTKSEVYVAPNDPGHIETSVDGSQLI
jgi:hypothetical protein